MFLLKVPERSPVEGLAFSPDGRLLAMSSGDGRVSVWSFADAAEIEIPARPGALAVPLAFSPDGRWLAYGRRGVRLWSVRRGQPGVRLPTDDADALVFAPAGRHVYAVGWWGVRRWAVPSGRAAARWAGLRFRSSDDRCPLGGLAVGPDGTVAVPVEDMETDLVTIHLLNSKNGKAVDELPTPRRSGGLGAIVFSPDGRRLAGVCGPSIYVWDMASPGLPLVYTRGTRHFKDLAFTPDGRRLVTVSNDQTVRLWDTATWAEAGGFEWKIGKLGAVAVAPDGLRMAAGGDAGKAVVWDVDA